MYIHSYINIFIVIVIATVGKKRKPLIKDLQNLVTPKYSCCWKQIGNQLNMPPGILDSIELGFPTNAVWCCNNMWKSWRDIDTKASWDMIIKAIDSPAISSTIAGFGNTSASSSSVANKMLKAVSDLACRVQIIYVKDRYKIEDDNSPLNSQKHFTSVALINHKGQQTKKEVLAMGTLQRNGDIDLDKITDDEYFKQSKCTKSIVDIFAEVKCTDGTNKCPDILLIEGVPGIGKTILSKEIVFQWANGRLLHKIKLMFLIYLRDTNSHKINSLKSFVDHVSYPEVAEHILKYIIDEKGENVMIIFDGYDELPEKFREDSFLYKLMTKTIVEIPLCNVVITSRPNASAHLHDKVDLRVEILGFTNEDREAYIVDALKGDDNKIKILMKYLNNNPAIDTYCYIPLNMSILLSFFINSDITEETELPKTQTGINEKFICTTVSRYIRKIQGLTLNFSNFSKIQVPCDDHSIETPCDGHKKGIPCGTILKEISKLAFKALDKDKIVFTTAELEENCPCLESQRDNWNGLGLLKAAKLFTLDNNSSNVTYNFLHFTIQEILAAYYITLMSEDDQINCMKEKFWSNRYYNTWIMYVGLLKNISTALKHFLSGNWLKTFTIFHEWWNPTTYTYIPKQITDDKLKCLYLFQCFSEAENDDLCKCVGQVLQKNEIDLSGQVLSAVNILTISMFLTRSTTKHWNILNLSECFIGDDGIKKLCNSFISNNRSKVCIDTLNLSDNNLTQSSVESIASLILEWNIKKLNISFKDNDLQRLKEEIMFQTMKLKKQNSISFGWNINENKLFFIRLSTSEYLSFGYLVSEEVTQSITEKSSHIKIIINKLKKCTKINYLNLNTTQFEVKDIAKVIRNNTFMEYLYLPKIQNAESIKLKVIFDALKSLNSLRYVDMSLITIESDLVKAVTAVMEKNNAFKEIKISKLLLGYTDFQHLKKYHLIKIRVLTLFSITDCDLTEQDADKLKAAITKNFEIPELNLSKCKIPINELMIILPIINKLEWLDLSKCQLQSSEIKQLFSILKHMKYLHYVDLSSNNMTSDSVNEIAAMIENNKDIQTLSLPNCDLDQEDVKIIVQAMKTVTSLQYVNFNTTEVDNELASDVATVFSNNNKLEKLNFAKLTLKESGFQDLKTYFIKLEGLKHVCVTDCKFTDQDAVYLKSIVGSISTICELIISNCKMTGHKVIAVTDSIGMLYQLENLELTNNSAINPFIDSLLILLSCSSELKQMTLCNCQLRPNEIKQLLMVLKYMRHLECVDLSGNAMTDDSVSDMEAMIINNKHLQKLCLPNCNCVLNQNSLRTIIQALQTASSLHYVDFGTNEVDNELASDVALSITNNSKLKYLKISKLTLNQSGFDYLKNYLVKLEGLKFISIPDCNIFRQDGAKLVTAMTNNQNIQDLDLSNCIIYIDQLVSILSCNTELQCLHLSNCFLETNKIYQVCSVLKRMKYLRHVDLSGNFMKSDALNEVVAMINNNKRIQSLSLPNCVLDNDLWIIIKALQTSSSLEYVDFSTNKIGNELASDVGILFANNRKLKQLNVLSLTLNQSGFHHLKDNLVKIKGLKLFCITGCIFTRQDTAKLRTTIINNSRIQYLNLSHCKLNQDQLFSHKTELKCLDLSECQLQSDEMKQIISVLKQMNNLQYVNLSGNVMKADSINGITDMIKSNKHIQELILPSCHGHLTQKDFKIIIQAMQTVSSLQHVDFSTNKVDNELSSDVALLISNNSELKHLKFSKLILNQSSFQHLKSYLAYFEGLKVFSITDCIFSGQDEATLVTAIANNSEIQELKLINCKINIDWLLSILSNNSKLKWLDLYNCQFRSNEIKQILNVLKKMNHLQYVDLRANTMTSDAITYVDLNLNKIDNELVNDVATLFVSNKRLTQFNFAKLAMKQSGFQHLKTYLAKIKRLKHLSISDCTFTNHDVASLENFVCSNQKLQELIILNSKITERTANTITNNNDNFDQLERIVLNNVTGVNLLLNKLSVFLICSSKLKQLKHSGNYSVIVETIFFSKLFNLLGNLL